ncbi:APC family permease [Candidatus Hepatobacter penaei]|uniref:APC family permease n=1 Tax=Candidatus Hepatobacter penaei TaxID=1274402 RepID=UPI0004F255C0|nr:amino acid permease [Candidatus Hepatobacter penaei]
MSNYKMGFWAVLSFVVSSQVGSGVFLFPHTLAPFGTLGLFAWGLAGAGAVCLALVFAGLCRLYPFTGGPHVYVTKGVNRRWGFYVAWTYWVLAWLSSAPVLGSIASAMCTLLGLPHDLWLILFFETAVLVGLTVLNLYGVEASGTWELCLTVIKFFPLVLFPLAALFFFQVDFLKPFNPTPEPWYKVLNHAGLMMLWGFLGLEAITAPAGSVDNPEKTLPKALVWGTLLALCLYVLNSVSVMGLVPRHELSQVVMPYSLALERLLGGGSGRLMAFFVIVVCVAAMNAWILAMGQVAKGAAEDGFFPKIFAQTNTRGVPVFGIIISSFLLFVCLIMLSSRDLATQVRFVIDVSVVSSVGIYALCVFVYWRKVSMTKWSRRLVGVGGTVLCAWILWGAGRNIILYALLLPVAGIPFDYMWVRRKGPGCALLS